MTVDIMVTVPDGVPLDGAVVELYAAVDPFGSGYAQLAADVRIPAPED